jgi:monoamine oxidase
VGLQFKRRFWEEDEHIYGGITYTDLPISRISYPSTRYGAAGPAVVLGAYVFEGPNSFEFGAMAPEERVRRAVEYGSQIHPQYAHEFDNGVSVAWYRVPGNHGCYGKWTDALRDQSHCVGRRARLPCPRVAGRRHPFLPRRNPAPTCARHRLMARAT